MSLHFFLSHRPGVHGQVTQSISHSKVGKEEDMSHQEPQAQDYESVKEAVRGTLKNSNWDDGSLGPLLVRLAWHASGTYDLKTRTGGSNGGTMRFVPESTDAANAGLQHARYVVSLSLWEQE